MVNLERLKKEKDLIGIHLSAHPLDQYKIPILYGCTAQMADMERLKQGDDCNFTVAGMVSGVRRGTTSKGNPFGILTLEDYSGAGEFALFGNDYTSFAGYLTENTFIAVQGRVQERGADWKFPPKKVPGEPRKPELKITSIKLLNDVADSMIHTLTISLELSRTTGLIVSELLSILDENKGSAELRFLVHDPETSTTMTLRSRKTGVDVNARLIEALQDLRDNNRDADDADIECETPVPTDDIRSIKDRKIVNLDFKIN